MLTLAAACGYEPVYGPETARLAVISGPVRVAQSEAVQAVLRGARAELATAGALRAGEGYPRVVVEVTRVDEIGSGIVAIDSEPVARGTAVGVTGRAWVEERRGAGASRDTGDLRRVERVAAPERPVADAERHSEALRAAGEAVGRALGRKVLGEPEPLDDAL